MYGGCVSGYFEILHAGHIRYFKKAYKYIKRINPYYELSVIVNNDHQLKQKKGYVLVPESQRLAIVKSIKYIKQAVISIDTDETVCETLKRWHPFYFFNSGDVNRESTKELDLCTQIGIVVVHLPDPKIESSSNIARRILDHGHLYNTDSRWAGANIR